MECLAKGLQMNKVI